jgi:DNA-binding CsgD family transcriptional regulator
MMAGDERVSALLRSGGVLDPELMALISACALDPSKWQAVLEKLSSSIGGLRTQMFGFDTQSGMNLGLLQQGYEPEALESYLSYYGQMNVWLPGFTKHRPGNAVAAQTLAPREVMENTAFYHEWVRPHENITGGGGALLFREDSRMFGFGGNIPAHLAEQLEPQFLALLDLLVGPLQQAFEVNRALAGLSLEKYVAGHAASQENAIFLLSPTGRLLYCNKVAEDLAKDGTVIGVGFGRRFYFSDAAAQERLEEALHPALPVVPQTFPVRASAHSPAYTSRMMAIQIDGLDHSPYGALIGIDEPAFILALTPRKARPDVELMLCQRFGLTAAEARVAAAIAQGFSPQEIAQRDERSVHTVRAQLKAAMTKTNSNRQVQLVGRVMTLQMGYPYD